MSTCEPIHELMLDYVYDLLEDDQAQSVREHLEGCPACQAALKEAQGQQQLLSRAAQVCATVPKFVAPDGDQKDRFAVGPPPQTLAAAPAPVEVAASFRPLSRWWRFAPYLIAASLLLAIGLGYTRYQQGMALRQAVVAVAKAEIAQVDAEFAVAKDRFDAEKRQLAATARESLHVQVSGPARYHPDVPTTLRVETTDLAGKQQKASLRVQLVDPVSELVVLQRDLACNGETTLQLPAGLEVGDNLTLDVLARTATASAQVKEELNRSQPTHVTHLALSKPAYHIGEVLFFRTLTLDHFSLKPPETPLQLRYALIDAQGKALMTDQGVTGPGGIGGGEFPLQPNLASGIYFVEITGADANMRVLPQKRRLEIFRDSTPQVEMDRAQYSAGEKGNLYLRYRNLQNQNAAPVANQAITLQPLNTRGGAVPGVQPQQMRTDNFGQAAFQVPKELDSNRLLYEIQVHDGKRNEKLLQAVRVVPSHVQVDFFPEGGELIEGVPTRVYYRVRSPQGEPVDPEGRVIVLSSTDVLYDSEPGQGVGVFTLTPRLNEKYTVRVTAPQTEIADPFRKLGIQPQGLVLAVPGGVTRAHEPLTVELGYKGEPRRVLVLVTCRGQIVDQRSLVVNDGKNLLTLQPTENAAGIVRVTVYEPGGADLVPLAERLAFRVPTHRLELAVSTSKDGKATNVQPGQNATLEIRGRDEKKQPAPFWALAAVVDEKANSAPEAGLPAHFYLLSDVQNGQELDEAHLILRDDPESWRTLDLFLGTQGWRRFQAAPAGPGPVFLAQKAGEDKKAQRVNARDRDQAVTTTAFFCSENASVEQLQQQHDTRQHQALTALQRGLAVERDRLNRVKDERVRAYNDADVQLHLYQEAFTRSLRLALGVVTLAALVIGGVFLLLGLVRMIQQKSPGRAYAVAFCSLGACLLIYLGAGPASESGRAVPLAFRSLPSVGEVAVHPSKAAQERRALPVGQYALVTKADGKGEREAAADRGKMMGNLDLVALARRAETLAAPAASAGLGGYGVAKAEVAKGDAKGNAKGAEEASKNLLQNNLNAEMQKRYVDAVSRQEKQEGRLAPPTAPSPSPEKMAATNKTPTAAKKMADYTQASNSYGNVVRKFAYRRDDQAPDTVLWYPVLFAADGTTNVQFDLPAQPAAYRVTVQANTPDGRLGFFETTLEVTAPGKK